MRRRFIHGVLGAGVAAIGLPRLAFGQAYPRQPVRIVVPYSAGGMTDVVGRLVAQRLSERLGLGVVVENRPGAATIVGAEQVAAAPADGHTLLAGTNATFTINPALYPKLPYDAARSFAPIALVAGAPSVVVVSPTFPAATFAEFVERLRREPGKYTYASFGNGSSAHLAGELFKSRTGTDVVHVPYKGSAPAKTAVIAGEVSMTFDPAFTAQPLVASGRLRALAVMSPQRSVSLPQVPTTAEAGYPGLEMSAWVGFAAPAGTPPAVLRRLASEIEAIMAMPAVQSQLLGSGAEPMSHYLDDFASRIRDEGERYRKVIADAGIRPE